MFDCLLKEKGILVFLLLEFHHLCLQFYAIRVSGARKRIKIENKLFLQFNNNSQNFIKLCISLKDIVLRLTGFGFPFAAQYRVAPVELENRIKVDGVLTNFGPIIIFLSSLIPLEEISVAFAPKEQAKKQTDKKDELHNMAFNINSK